MGNSISRPAQVRGGGGGGGFESDSEAVESLVANAIRRTSMHVCVLLRRATLLRSIIGNSTLTISTFLVFSPPLSSAPLPACTVTSSFCVFFFYRPTGTYFDATCEAKKEKKLCLFVSSFSTGPRDVLRSRFRRIFFILFLRLLFLQAHRDVFRCH